MRITVGQISSLSSTVESAVAKLPPVIGTLLNDMPAPSNDKKTALEPYTYTQLPTRSSIRLLRLDKGSKNAPISCSMRIVNQEDGPKYTALSYTWKKDRSASATMSHFFGHMEENWQELVAFLLSSITALFPQQKLTMEDYMADIAGVVSAFRSVPAEFLPEDMHTIICNGKSLKVQHNLHDALRSLRDSELGNLGQEYWIDAICIDQANDPERSTQVEIMDRIYSLADRVVVWLGTFPSMLKTGLDELLKQSSSRPESIAVKLKSGARLSKKELATLVSAGVIQYLLLTRGWWRRLWVIQEYCLAQDVVMLLGTQQIRIEDVKYAMNFGQDANSTTTSSSFVEGFPGWPRVRHSCLEMLEMRLEYQIGKRWSLTEWLGIVKGRKATDAEDVINAGLALIKPEDLMINTDLGACPPGQGEAESPEGLRTNLWKMLHVDYGASISEVLLNLAACLITNFGWETLFYYTLLFRSPPAHAPASFPLLPEPSWVMDPSPWSSLATEPFFMCKNPGIPLPKPIDDYGPIISRQGSALSLTGLKLDVVKSCSCICFPRKPHERCDTLRLLRFILECVPATYGPTGTTGIEALSNIWNAAYDFGESYTYPPDTIASLSSFCAFIFGLVTQHKPQEGEETDRKGWDLGSATLILKEQVKQISSLWRKIKALYATAPWPQEKNSTPDTVAVESERPHASSANAELAANSFVIFTTKNGYMGLGPSCTREGDYVFLLSGGRAPYICRSLADVLSKRKPVIIEELARMEEKIERAKTRDRHSWDLSKVAERLNETSISDVMNETSIRDLIKAAPVYKKIEERTKEQLIDELRRIEARKAGDTTGWQLVGQAYVEGVMNGEVAEKVAPNVQRYDFV